MSGEHAGSAAGRGARSPGAGFTLDLHRCVGCGACVLACRIENGRTGTAPWRRVVPVNLVRRLAGPTYFLSVACHHCDKPACLAGCPSRAYEKRADGVVLHHAERCLGCRYCEMACPFGAPQYDPDRGIVSKCTLCAPRLDDGRLPACVTACPTGALQLAPPGRDTGGEALRDVPGFVDPAGCGPSLRFRAPAGARREQLFRALQEAMAR
ncbi:MAG TPA: 4Fe-4S dicluster domain-containing protein [Vicinamibacterales bacterium]|nr:4Fe-4S dicluster domain-containing protein [Vicinamibacterales bacterium]HOQ61647.1 4Fe-4S dicluster domain-containing protein [Vicinamibacterales bacterium]HPK71826.1 4Fe-4S dicluster domain-containing protein [Vicinamibacterales bacterium]